MQIFSLICTSSPANTKTLRGKEVKLRAVAIPDGKTDHIIDENERELSHFLTDFSLILDALDLKQEQEIKKWKRWQLIDKYQEIGEITPLSWTNSISYTITTDKLGTIGPDPIALGNVVIVGSSGVETHGGQDQDGVPPYGFKLTCSESVKLQLWHRLDGNKGRNYEFKEAQELAYDAGSHDVLPNGFSLRIDGINGSDGSTRWSIPVTIPSDKSSEIVSLDAYEHKGPPAVARAARQPRTSIRLPWSANQAYFFRESGYVKIDCSTDKMVDSDWHWTQTNWAGLSYIKYLVIDAWLPIPGSNDAYAFARDQYLRYNIRSDEVKEGPAQWATKWPGLKEAGFDIVDAALPIDASNDAWFFGREMCARIDTTTGKIVGTAGTISEHFSSLASIGFTQIDTALGTDHTANRAWIFCGDYYVWFDVTNNKILTADAPRLTKDYWTSLVACGFY